MDETTNCGKTHQSGGQKLGAVLAIFCLLICALAPGSLAKAQSGKRVVRIDSYPVVNDSAQDKQFLAGLRNRRMYDLATSYCQRRLESKTLSAEHRAVLAIEQIKCYTSQAIFSPASERQASWDAIDGVVTRFKTNAPPGQGPPPRFFLVQVQQALAHMAHANLLSQELAAELIPQTESARALEELRSARKLLNQLEKDIRKAVPERSNPTQEGVLDAEALLALVSNIRFQLAECNLIRAQLYQDDSAGKLGRVDALGQVQKQLNEVVRSVTPMQPLWWQTRIARIKCLRLLERVSEANQLLAESASLEVPSEFTAMLMEEKVLLATLARDANALQQLMMVVNAPGAAMETSATLDLAILKATLALSLLADRAEQKQLWLAEANRSTKRIETQHGRYWGRRAELLLVEAVGGTNRTNTGIMTNAGAGTGSTEVDLLTRVGDEAFRKKRFKDALNAYDGAIKKAIEQGNATPLLRLQVQAGQALEQMGNHRDAANRMMTAAENAGSNPVAPAAHLRGCWNQAKVVSTQKANSESLLRERARFQVKLDTHLKRWPGSSTSGQAAIWLGESYLKSQDYQRSTMAFLSIPTSHDQFFATINRAANSAEQWLADLSTTERQDAAREIDNRLRSIRVKIDPASEQALQLKLLAQHLQLLFADVSPPEFQLPDSIGNAAIRQLASPMARYSEMVKSEDPREILRQIASVDELETIEGYLNAQALRSTDNPKSYQRNRVAVAEYALNNIKTDGSTDVQITRWRLKKIDALMAIEEYATAISELEKLEQKFPRKADIKMMLARAMSQGYGKSDPERVIKKWRTIAARLKPGSDFWWEAKWNVIQLLQSSGQKKAAQKLLRYLEITPGWGDSKWKSKFDSLKRSLIGNG